MASLHSQPGHLLAVVCPHKAEEGWLRALHANCCHTSVDRGITCVCTSPLSWPRACRNTKLYHYVDLGLYYPSWKHVFSLTCSLKTNFFFSLYLLHDLCVDGSVSFNFSDLQDCASALQTCKKMSFCLNEIIIFEGNNKH